MIIKHRTILELALCLIIGLGITATARTRTTQHRLTSQAPALAEIEASSDADSTASAIAPHSTTLRGFNKKASDSKETFLVTNNTARRMSSITLRLRYSTLKGEMLHERTVKVDIDLKPGQTKMASIKSFDTQRMFYYYASAKPRKAATPFKVQFRLVGYTVPIE